MSQRTKLGLTALAVAGIAMLTPAIAHAAPALTIPDNPSSISTDDVTRIVVELINFLLVFAGGIGALFIVVNGFQYIIAAGNPEKIEKAKMGLTWSIGGFILAVSSYAVVLLVQNTFASNQKISSAPGISGAKQGAPSHVGDILRGVFDLLLVFAGAVAVLFLILGGYRYVTSAGNEERAEQAKKTILYAVIGLIVTFLAYSLVVLTQQALFKP